MTTNEKITLLKKLINHFENYQPWCKNLKLCKYYCLAVDKYGEVTKKKYQKYNLNKKHTVKIQYFTWDEETFTGTIREIAEHINNYYKENDSNSVYTNQEIEKIIADAENTGTIDMSANYESAADFHNWGDCEIVLDEYAEYLRMARYAQNMLKNHLTNN